MYPISSRLREAFLYGNTLLNLNREWQSFIKQEEKKDFH